MLELSSPDDRCNLSLRSRSGRDPRKASHCHELQLLDLPKARCALGLLSSRHRARHRPRRINRGIPVGKTVKALRSVPGVRVHNSRVAGQLQAGERDRGEHSALRPRRPRKLPSSPFQRSGFLEVHRLERFRSVAVMPSRLTEHFDFCLGSQFEIHYLRLVEHRSSGGYSCTLTASRSTLAADILRLGKV